MASGGVKITYLFNSGFLVETTNHLLLFDYYRAQARQDDPRRFDQISAEAFFQTDKAILNFVSHRHRDHYNPIVLRWLDQDPRIKCILSNDIRPGREDDRLILVGPGEERSVGALRFKTFGSTDEGVSFLVEVDGVTLFHAGDLNWWYWWDDSPAEIALAERRFKAEIARLKGEKIEIAFFPVDPRLEHNFYRGGEYFITELQPEIFVPMHFGEAYETIDRFAECVRGIKTRVVRINRSPQVIMV
ncbi:MAG: MBL fold metallo-hydrolase [Firmicutes bacterium]|nr:MBL fold metallo-hydrolase [Bacillota bacterium]